MAIQELPLIYREILYLQSLEEYKLPVILKLVGIGIEAVKNAPSGAENTAGTTDEGA